MIFKEPYYLCLPKILESGIADVLIDILTIAFSVNEGVLHPVMLMSVIALIKLYVGIRFGACVTLRSTLLQSKWRVVFQATLRLRLPNDTD